MAKQGATAIREPFRDRLLVGFIYVFLGIVLVSILYPLINIVSSSFSSGAALQAGKVWLLPVEPTLMGYKAVFKNPQIFTGYFNSLLYTVAGTFINVVLTVAIAYPLSKRGLVGRNLVMALLVVTMLFEGGLIPYYLTVKSYGILDTRWAMLLPTAMAVWQVIIARTFFQMNIPHELNEAAEIDGCSDLRFIWSVVLALSKPILAVLTLMYAVMNWNAYFDALIFLKSHELFPLQVVLRGILIMNTVSANMTVDADALQAKQALKDLLKYSLIVVSSAPVLILYPFVQKHFVKGVLIGSIKG